LYVPTILRRFIDMARRSRRDVQVEFEPHNINNAIDALCRVRSNLRSSIENIEKVLSILENSKNNKLHISGEDRNKAKECMTDGKKDASMSVNDFRIIFTSTTKGSVQRQEVEIMRKDMRLAVRLVRYAEDELEYFYSGEEYKTKLKLKNLIKTIDDTRKPLQKVKHWTCDFENLLRSVLVSLTQ
ncbi:MAG: hypothetical protein Q4A26_02275, partial [Candidatus Saccharibacteria bacterium]|nr:hypothetical protein [Candidatus Saccharibacteria bacterium]